MPELVEMICEYEANIRALQTRRAELEKKRAELRSAERRLRLQRRIITLSIMIADGEYALREMQGYLDGK